MPKGLAEQLNDVLKVYAKNVTEKMKKAAVEVTNRARREVQNDSPVRWGRYAASWRSKKIFESPLELKLVVHNKVYQLPHLLEKGHTNRDGSFTPGYPHIKPAEEKAIKDYEKLVKEAAKG